MGVIENIRQRAKKNYRTIVLPEGEEERIMEAAAIIHQEKIARIILLGDEKKIYDLASKKNIDLTGINLINPQTDKDFEAYLEKYYQLRKHKGINIEDARKTMLNPLYFGCMLVRKNQADGLVGGSVNTTAETVRASLQIVGLTEGNSTLSSFFLMIVPDCSYGANGVFMYADCGVVPDPSPKQLCNITLATAQNTNSLLNIEPIVALLSFSTKGSAEHPMLDKIKKALELIKEKNPSLVVDGEFQADAALVPEVGQKKAPQSPVAGRANVLIFPDLNSGNIAYKLTQRLAKAEAYGPIFQGLAKPVNDLSRGCSVTDIVNVVAITGVQ